jgi:hypothetical protein
MGDCRVIRGVPLIYSDRDDNPPIPDTCPDCGKPYSPDTITYIEVTVVSREDGELVRKMNEANGYA